MTNKNKTVPFDFRRNILEESVSLVSIPLCLITTGFYLASIHSSISTQSFNVSLFVLLSVALILRSIANIIDSYSAMSEPHALDAFEFVKSLKSRKVASAIPNLNIARRMVFIITIGLALNDLTLRYMVSSVGESFYALETNELVFSVSIIILICVELLSIFSKTSTSKSVAFSNKIYLLDIVVFICLGVFAFSNMNNEQDKQTLIYCGVEMEFPTAYSIHIMHKPEDLVYPALLGSKPAAIKLLGTITANELANDNNLTLNLAKILVMNIDANETAVESNYYFPVMADIPNAYSKGDRQALMKLIDGDLTNFKLQTHQIINDIDNNNHSYAANLLKLIMGSSVDVDVAKGENKVSTIFTHIMNGKHKS